MKHFTVNELSLAKYHTITDNRGEVSGGSRPRLTLYRKDNNQKYFFKTYSHNPREVWAECLASHVADLVGIAAQAVTIKTTPARLKEVEQHHIKKTSWRPRLKKSLAKVSGIDLLALAGLVIQMPTLDILEYDTERRRLLYKSLLMRYNKLRELYGA